MVMNDKRLRPQLEEALFTQCRCGTAVEPRMTTVICTIVSA